MSEDAKKIERLRKLLRELRCTDGGCIFRVPDEPCGMVTNGGCHCLREFRDGADSHDPYHCKLRRVISMLVGIVAGEAGATPREDTGSPATFLERLALDLLGALTSGGDELTKAKKIALEALKRMQKEARHG